MLPDEKQIYIVRTGRRFGARNQYEAGADIELTAAEYEGFKDKLIPKPVVLTEAESVLVAEVEEEKAAAVAKVKANEKSKADLEAEALIAEAQKATAKKTTPKTKTAPKAKQQG